MSGYDIFCYHMKTDRKSLNDWVIELQKAGRYCFTRAEAAQKLGQRPVALDKALQRLCSAGRLFRPRKRFYVIVPVEYQPAGVIPSEWFIGSLMRFLDRPYYVGCLSAAALYGAAHQRPQELQVVVPDHVRPIETKALRIRFLQFSGMRRALTQPRRTHTGDYPVSTPEWTAMDLIRFQKHYGSLDAAATVLSELGEALNPDKLVKAAERESCNAHLQRLGWMLDFLGFNALTGPLHRLVARRKPSFASLNAALKKRSGSADMRWHIRVNEEPESEL